MMMNDLSNNSSHHQESDDSDTGINTTTSKSIMNNSDDCDYNLFRSISKTNRIQQQQSLLINNHHGRSQQQPVIQSPPGSQKRTLQPPPLHAASGSSSTTTTTTTAGTGTPLFRSTQQQQPLSSFHLRSFVSHFWREGAAENHHDHPTTVVSPLFDRHATTTAATASCVPSTTQFKSELRTGTHTTTTTTTQQQHHLDSNVLQGLTIAGVASSILHTMMGLQTEQHILSSIITTPTSHTNKNHPHNDSNDSTDPNNRNLVMDLIMNNSTAISTHMETNGSNDENQIMIRTTHSHKLHYDLLIRIIGTAIILYYSIHPLPFQHYHQQQRSSCSKGQQQQRLDMIGIMGLLFVSIFLIVQQIPILLPLYEWMRLLLIVVIASPVINDITMYDTVRIQFIMSGQVINFITTVLVRYICETITVIPQIVITNLFVTLSAVLFVTAQNTIRHSNNTIWTIQDALLSLIMMRRPRIKEHTENDDDDKEHHQQQQPRLQTSVLQTHAQPPSIGWYRIMYDILNSNDIQRWIIMQVLLEIQMSVLYLLFLYTILYETERDVNETRVLWTLFRLRKVDTILVHVPMFLFGYSGVYYSLFITIFVLSLCAYAITDQPVNALSTVHTVTIFFYISCMAVHSAGFNVAMADLTMSLRYNYAKTSTTTVSTDNNHHRRSDHHHHHEPNIAGMLIAYNSFMCKPITYFISGMVATILRHGRSTNTLSSTAFNVLIYTMMITSSVQLYVWKRYELVKHRTTMMRDELFPTIPK